jgi:hypothetical protein
MAGLENVLPVVLWDRGAGIFDIDPVVINLSNPNSHIGSTMFDGVSKEILEDVLEPTLIADECYLVFDLDRCLSSRDRSPTGTDKIDHLYGLCLRDNLALSGKGEGIGDKLFDSVQRALNRSDMVTLAFLLQQLRAPLCDVEWVSDVM